MIEANIFSCNKSIANNCFPKIAPKRCKFVKRNVVGKYKK